ncbi:MAG TPA: hypothetical protein K8V15_01550 [Tessaracoccus flavescens]|uniref:Uncharacterized protein n=1 Tax=Tessaracoccus flavescens TaxID=399497 RepID=A0A921JQ48_9ACTN|nr:hypothetical protein [Tessaracoccus flavescens]
MKGLFWMMVGAGLTIFVILRGREIMHRFTPKGVQEQVSEKGHQAAATFGDFMGTFRAAMDEREAELRRELNIPAASH